jgi:tetratricopeptide (TPR) repeat protein
MASPQRKPEPAASNKEESTDASQPNAAGGPDPQPDDGGYYEGLQVTAPEKKDGAGKAFLHVFLATAILGGGLFLYWQKVQRDEEVHNRAAEARGTYLRDNFRDLQDADRLLTEALELDDRHGFSLATRGLINGYLWLDHGLADRRSVSESFTAQAEERGARIQERYAARALILLGSGNAVEAERMLVDDVINEGGSGPAIFGALGLSQRAQGKLTDARSALQRAAEAERRSPRFNHWIAQMYFDGEEHGNAATFVERALDVNPDHVLTLVLRSRNQIARGDGLKQASETLEEILGRGDREVSPRVRALALVGQSEHRRFERNFQESLTLADQALEVMALPEAHLARGFALAGLRQDGALDAIRAGLDGFQYAPRAYHQAARILLAGQRPDDALEVMNLWGERLPRNADYHIAFGNLLVEKRDNEEAKSHYEQAIALNPRASEAHYRLGTLAVAADDVQAAIDHFNEAVRIRERYPEVYEAMGWIYMEQRHFADSLRQFVHAINYYQAQNADRQQLNRLRRDVGAALNRHRQRRMAQMWLTESRELIR